MEPSRRRGILSEVLVSLAVAMLAANALLAALLVRNHGDHLERLRGLLGSALAAEARAPLASEGRQVEGARWWLVLPGERVLPRSTTPGAIPEEALALAREARGQREALLRTGLPWEPVRFALRVGGAAEVAVAELPPALHPGWLVGLVLADALVFAALGASLLRRGVIRPLRELALSARSLGEGDLVISPRVDGVGEVEELAQAFLEMSETIQRRTTALEKAVVDLREANRSLRDARAGLDRAERLAAVGHLAAGVAHEVGNPMGALLAFLDLVGRDAGLGTQGRTQLERARHEGERVRRILRQLLDFSRPPRAEHGPVDLAEVARQTVDLLRPQRRYAGIRLDVEAAEGLPLAQSDASLLAQILLNLVLNACDAVAGLEGARVRLRIEPGVLATRGGEGDGDLPEGREPDSLRCLVEDSGPGISEEDRERIFDPFFTTKPPGEGTGLGLANAQRLSEELGGRLLCGCSEDLGGARFVLLVPRAGSERIRKRVRGAQASA